MLTDAKNKTKHALIRAVSTRENAVPQQDWSMQANLEVQASEQSTAAPISSHSFDSVGVFAQESGLNLQRDLQEGGVAVPANLGTRIGSQLGQGATLESQTQKQFGNALQHDFSNVRIHADSEADALSRSVSAKAFTTGQDIFFKQGQFNPHSGDGQKLLAHELTHTVQQSRGMVAGTSTTGGVNISDPSDAFEQEATQTAESVSQNQNTAVQTEQSSSLGGVQVQRLTDEEKTVNLRSPRFVGNARLQDAFDNNKPVHMGETGEAIVKIQETLIESGIPLPNSTQTGTPDGIFGQETRKAVITYQSRHGIDTDGAVGRQTLGAMDAQAGGGPRVTPTVVTPPTPAGGTITGNPTDVAANVTTNPDGTQTINKLGTTHAAPTIGDAVNHAGPAAAGDDRRVTYIKIIRDDTSPVETLGIPESDTLYHETGAAQAGFTATTGFAGTMAEPIIEEVADNSLYINNTPSPDDVQQFGIGDCYFLALVTSLAARDPNKIKEIMTSDGNGGATVLLWQKIPIPPATPGAPPTATYQQVAVQVSDQLAFDRSAASALGTAAANDRQTQGNGFHIHGAQLRAADAPSESAWWAHLNGDIAHVHRRDTFQMARWAPLLEKGFARFTESYGQYGGAHLTDAPASNPTAGYENIDGGWSHDTMVIFYGASADREGSNEGNAHQTATAWTPGSDVVMSNQAAINDLILLQGRGNGQQEGDTNAPLLTATAMTNLHMPRLKDSIIAAQADPDWTNLNAKTQTDCLAIPPLVDAWVATTNTTTEQTVGNACVTAADPTQNADLHLPARSKPLKDMLELLADVRNAGTDHSSGQRNIYGNHVYSIMAVDFLSSTGDTVPLATTPIAARAALLPSVDAIRSNITMQNPHHANEPDLENTGPTDGNNDGRFNMTLDQFFRNFTSVEAGVFPTTAPTP